MRKILLPLLVLPLVGCYSVNSTESVEVTDDLPVDERIEMAKAIVDSLWSGGLRAEIHEQFPELTRLELLGVGLNWRAAHFKPFTGEDRATRTTVTITCTMRQKFRFELGRPVATYCRELVDEALAERSAIELDSAMYRPAVAYVRKVFPAAEILIHPRTIKNNASPFGQGSTRSVLMKVAALKEFAGEDLADGFGSTFESALTPSCGAQMLSSEDAALLEARPEAVLDRLRRRYGKVFVVQFSTPRVDPNGSALLYYEFRAPDEDGTGNVLKLSRDDTEWEVDGQLSVALS